MVVDVSQPPQRRFPANPRILLLVEQPYWLAAACLPPQLREAGMLVDVICRPGSLVAKSRFVEQVVLAGGTEVEYFAAVREFLACHRGRYLAVIPVTDTDIRGLALRIDESWVHDVFPAHPAREVAAALLGKPAMDDLLRRAGLALPASSRISTAGELEAFGHAVGWPVMLKPVDGVGGGGVVRVENATEAAAAMAQVDARYPELMAQAFVPGPVASCQVIFNRGEPLAWATSYKVRTWPGPYGPSCAITFAPIPGVAEMLPLIGRALGFHGPLTVDLIVDERSRAPVVIEVNARPAGIMSRGRRGGVDFAAALRQLWLGVPANAHLQGTRVTVTAGLYPQDLLRWFEEEDDAAPQRPWFEAAAVADMPWRDPRVFLSSTRFLISRLLRGA